jgi:hypothetical protein
VQIGPQTFQTDPADVDFLIQVVNDFPGVPPADKYVIRSAHNLPVSGLPIDEIQWQMDDHNTIHQALNSTSLSAVPPDPARWDPNSGLQIRSGATQIVARITEIYSLANQGPPGQDAVPPAGSYLFLASGAAPPPGYTLTGTFEAKLGKKQKVVIAIWQKD